MLNVGAASILLLVMGVHSGEEMIPRQRLQFAQLKSDSADLGSKNVEQIAEQGRRQIRQIAEMQRRSIKDIAEGQRRNIRQTAASLSRAPTPAERADMSKWGKQQLAANDTWEKEQLAANDTWEKEQLAAQDAWERNALGSSGTESTVTPAPVKAPPPVGVTPVTGLAPVTAPAAVRPAPVGGAAPVTAPPAVKPAPVGGPASVTAPPAVKPAAVGGPAPVIAKVPGKSGESPDGKKANDQPARGPQPVDKKKIGVEPSGASTDAMRRIQTTRSILAGTPESGVKAKALAELAKAEEATRQGRTTEFQEHLSKARESAWLATNVGADDRHWKVLEKNWLEKGKVVVRDDRPLLEAPPRYGNYGGIRYTGGRDMNRPPINDMDAVFKRHDEAYRASEKQSTELLRRKAIVEADQKLVRELQQLNMQHVTRQQIYMTEHLDDVYRRLAIELFSAKAKQGAVAVREIERVGRTR